MSPLENRDQTDRKFLIIFAKPGLPGYIYIKNVNKIEIASHPETVNTHEIAINPETVKNMKLLGTLNPLTTSMQ